MTLCKVKGCRHNNMHTTSGHKCGKCNKYGHGRLECGKVNLINKLSKHLNDKMPYHNRCKFVNCKHRWSHSTKGHHCHKCFLNHNSNDCMLATKEEAERKYNVILDNYITRLDNNMYTSMYMGMGCILYIRKKDDILDTIYMHSDNWGQYGPETDHSKVYNKFIENLDEYIEPLSEPDNINTDNVNTDEYKCPYCRSINNKNKIMKLKGNEQKCCICLDNNINIYFPECEHSVVCEKCFEKI